MRHYFDTVEDRVTGRPVAGAQIYVRTAPIAAGGVNATIYSDDETVPTAITQPIVTGQDGFFSFYAADGRYCLQIYYNGALIRTLEDVEVSNSLADAQAAATSASAAALSAAAAEQAFETGLPQLEAFADAAATSAGEAEAYAQALFVDTFSIWYSSLAAGAAAVAEGESFIVVDGGTVVLGKKVGGVGVEQAEFATMAAFLAELSGVITVDEVQTLTNKTIALGSNSVSGTLAQFNDALTDANFATLAGAETLTNKTIALGSNTLSGTLAQFNAAVSDADLTSTAALAATTGADLIGVTGGGSVQDAIDAIRFGNEGYVDIAADATGFDGTANDATAFQGAIDALTALALPGGTAWLGKRRARLNGQVNVKRSVALDLKSAQIDAYVGTGAAAFAFGKGTTGQVNQIGGAELKNLRLEMQTASGTGIWIENAGGNSLDNIGINLRADNQVGFYAKACDDPPGPYYAAVNNLAVRGSATPSAGQIAIRLDGKPVFGMFGINGWTFSNVRDCSAVDYGIDIRGADGVAMSGVVMEAIYQTGIRFGHGNRSQSGAVTTAGATSVSFTDTSLIGSTLDNTTCSIIVTSGPNSGFSARIKYFDTATGLVVLNYRAPYKFTVGNTFTLTETKARSNFITGLRAEWEPADAGVNFTAGSTANVVEVMSLTQSTGYLMKRAVEDPTNRFGRYRQTVEVPFTYVVGTDGATGSKVITPGSGGGLTRGGIVVPFPSFVDAVRVSSNRGDDYDGEITIRVWENGTAIATTLQPKLTRDSPVFGIRVRKELTGTTADFVDPGASRHIELVYSGMTVDCSGVISLDLVSL